MKVSRPVKILGCLTLLGASICLVAHAIHQYRLNDALFIIVPYSYLGDDAQFPNPDDSAVIAALNAGADINARDEWGWSLLHSACSNSQIGRVKMLLRFRPDVNIRDFQGRTPLDVAEGDRLEVVSVMRQAGAKTAYEPDTR